MRCWALKLAGAGFLLAGLASCKEPPNQFRVIALEEAEQHLRTGAYTVVEAQQPPADPSQDSGGDHDPGGDGRVEIRWELPLGALTELAELPPGPLLIVASSPRVGYRSAAAAARARHRDVLLFISESAEQRRTLYAPLAAKGASS